MLGVRSVHGVCFRSAVDDKAKNLVSVSIWGSLFGQDFLKTDWLTGRFPSD